LTDDAIQHILTEKRVFTAIVAMCRKRILIRLGLAPRSSWGHKRQPIKKGLEEIINGLSVVKAKDKQLVQAKTATVASAFTDRAKEVMKQTDAWSNHQTLGALEELVQKIHHLSDLGVGDLEGLVKTIPRSLVDSNSQRSILNMVGKVARYREAARFLCRLARKFPIVRRMRIVRVDLPEESFLKPPAAAPDQKGVATPSESSSHELQAKLSQIAPKRQDHGQQQQPATWQLANLCGLMGVKQPEKASKQFSRLVAQETLKGAKIHAEIQLLFHCCELRKQTPKSRMPRVVCSSKDACFLCNLFIRMHGKMYTPKTHGRLCPGWRLPHVPNEALQRRFNQVLDEYARQSIGILLARGKEPRQPDPNESTLFTLPWSMSTLLSKVSLIAPPRPTPAAAPKGESPKPKVLLKKSPLTQGPGPVEKEAVAPKPPQLAGPATAIPTNSTKKKKKKKKSKQAGNKMADSEQPGHTPPLTLPSAVVAENGGNAAARETSPTRTIEKNDDRLTKTTPVVELPSFLTPPTPPPPPPPPPAAAAAESTPESPGPATSSATRQPGTTATEPVVIGLGGDLKAKQPELPPPDHQPQELETSAAVEVSSQSTEKQQQRQSSHSNITKASSLNNNDDDRHLTQNQSRRRHLRGGINNNNFLSPLYDAGPGLLELQVACGPAVTVSQTATSRPAEPVGGESRGLQYNIEWVGEEEAKLIQEQHHVVEAEALSFVDETLCRLDDAGHLYVAHRGCVIRVTIHSAGASQSV